MWTSIEICQCRCKTVEIEFTHLSAPPSPPPRWGLHGYSDWHRWVNTDDGFRPRQLGYHGLRKQGDHGVSHAPAHNDILTTIATPKAITTTPTKCSWPTIHLSPPPPPTTTLTTTLTTPPASLKASLCSTCCCCV